MRTVTYGAACSLDGFITGPDESIDWLRWNDDVQTIMTAYWKTVDTLVMGRKTWEFAARQGGGPSRGSMHSYVFSRTLAGIDRSDVTLVNDDPGAFVRELKSQPGRDICVLGGSDLARSLLAAGVVDEVGVNVHPVLLGSGVPLFVDCGRRVSLELKETRAIHGGCVYSTYRVSQNPMDYTSS
jgi:dihydrofolate reductase